MNVLIFGAQDSPTMATELDKIEREAPGAYVGAYVQLGRAEIARLDGDFANARRLTQRAIDAFQAMGTLTMATCCSEILSEVELQEGHPDAARALLAQADARLEEIGELNLRSTMQALLARVNERLGDHDAARAAIELSDQLSAAEDVINYALTHAVRARLAVADRDRDAAERWARSAVEHAFLTDLVGWKAKAKLEFAKVLSALGQQEEAISEARAARDLFKAKGDRPGVGETQALLDNFGLSI